MENPKEIKRKERKRLGVAILFFVLGVALFVGIRGFNSSQDSEKQLAAASSEAMDLLQLKEEITRQREQMLLLILAESPAQQKTLEASVHKHNRKIDEILDTFTEIARRDSNLNRQLQELKKVRALSQKTRDQEVIPLIHAGHTSQARRLLTGIQQQRFDKMRELAKAVTVNAQDKAIFDAVEYGRKSNRAFVTLVVTFLTALIAGIGIVLWFSRASFPD